MPVESTELRLHRKHAVPVSTEGTPDVTNPTPLEKNAKKFRDAELQYFEAVTDLFKNAEVAAMQSVQVSEADVKIEQGFSAIGKQRTILNAQRTMRELTTGPDALVIGGPRGELKIGTVHRHNPSEPTYVSARKGHLISPLPGMKLLILESEVGVIDNGNYKQVLSAGLSTPRAQDPDRSKRKDFVDEVIVIIPGLDTKSVKGHQPVNSRDFHWGSAASDEILGAQTIPSSDSTLVRVDRRTNSTGADTRADNLLAHLSQPSLSDVDIFNSQRQHPTLKLAKPPIK